MLRQIFRLIVIVCFLPVVLPASAITVTVNADAAKAVLQALQNPALTYDEALRIAQLPGNQGIIRKENDFKVPLSNESFANALVAAAHGQKATDPILVNLFFDIVKPKAPQLLQLVRQIEANPETFQASIEKRIGLFTVPGSEIRLQGYIVAGGDGGGYAFGDTNFYLNIGFMDDFILAKSATTHELYHAVQGAFAGERGAAAEPSRLPLSPVQQGCASTARLFASLYEEGTATYVEDISLLPQSHSESANRKLADMTDGLRHIHDSATLLEMSVTGLKSANAVSYDDVYNVGFLGHGVLYYIGYVMAKAIVENDGPQGLAAFLKRPPYKFVLRYTQLPAYGMDKDHPTLGPNTIDAANQLANGCN
jgi:hypothetical protein